MARYPVTIDQFAAFVQDCYRDGRWQLPPGCPVDRRLQEPPTHRGRHGNHTADTVNWFDATAFCYWLSVRLGYEIRLPTEFEWQLAATGGDPVNTYPCGPDWDPEREPWRANTYESRLGRSTAVGMYRAGASKKAVQDLAGTIWEWCRNTHARPGETAVRSEDEDPRVVRGGSWSGYSGYARCAFRFWLGPGGRLVSFGFRVVCSSPITNR